MPAARTVDVQTFLNEHPFSRFQWMIFTLCFCVVLLDGFDTAAIGYIAPSLITEWGLERPALAPVLSAALFGLAAGALFSGPLADRLGRKAVLMVSVLIIGAEYLMSAFAGSLDQLVVWRFATGVDRADCAAATRVCALHGCQEPACRAHSQRAAPHRRNGARRNLVRHARENGGNHSKKRHRHGGLELLPRGLGEFVGGLFHGLGDLLRADQLDAAPVQGCGT